MATAAGRPHRTGDGLVVCEAVLWRSKAAAAPDDIRSMRHGGSLRLLWGMTEWGFDPERLIE